MDELTAIVQEAAAADRFVMAHAIGTVGIKNAVRAGVHSIEHGCFLDDEAIDLMLDHGTYWVPTLIADQGVIESYEAGMRNPSGDLLAARSTIEASRESFAKALDAGVRIAMGSDACVIPHGENLREMALMAEWGMAPERVLRSATIDAAELMGLADELGSLEPGKRADVVVVDGDPFDIKTLAQRIVAVYKDGHQVVG
jgi:imidazolonepropionase-like amidohydrolase